MKKRGQLVLRAVVRFAANCLGHAAAAYLFVPELLPFADRSAITASYASVAGFAARFVVYSLLRSVVTASADHACCLLFGADDAPGVAKDAEHVAIREVPEAGGGNN